MMSKVLTGKSLINKCLKQFSGAGSPKLWGGRFSRDTDQSILNWIESISTDKHFVVEDIWGSISHVAMLGHQKVIPWEAAQQILPTLLRFQNEYIDKKWEL